MLYTSVLLMAAGLLLHVGAQSNDLSGGSTGDDNNDFLEGTANTFKIYAGYVCHKPNASWPLLTVDVFLYEADDAFNDSATSVKIRYDTVHTIDTDSFLTDGERSVSVCNMTLEDTSSPFTGLGEVDQKTHSLSITGIDTTSANGDDLPCGGKKTATDEYTFVAHAQRTWGMDKHFDSTFKFVCKENSNILVLTSISDATAVSNPNFVEVIRNWILIFNVFRLANGGTIPTLTPITAGSTDVSTPATYELGQTFFFQICLSTTRTSFFEDGRAPVGVQITDCTASISSTDALSASSYTASIADLNGCNTGNEPFGRGSTASRFFAFVENAANVKETSPNCWLTEKWEVASFARKLVGQTVTMTMTCKIRKYCTSLTDALCFGTRSTDCGSGRRKRQLSFDEDGEEQISTQVTIINKYPDELEGEAATQDQCFEQVTFISLVVVLAVLLIVVLAIAAFLAVRVRAMTREDRESSLSGFANKGYH